MITWRPECANEVANWKIAMILSEECERILIGSAMEINLTLAGKNCGAIHCDVKRPLGSFLLEFDDDSAERRWTEALLCLKEAQSVSLAERIIHVLDKESYIISFEKRAQQILKDKFDSGDPICQYVALRIWCGYWCVREKKDKKLFQNFLARMENLVLPFSCTGNVLRESRLVRPDDPIFRWSNLAEDSDGKIIIYKQRQSGMDNYVIADDSLSPLKFYYADSLEKCRFCVIRCKGCGKLFVARTLHTHYCGESCRSEAIHSQRETRFLKQENLDIEKLCRNEYAYWYNRFRRARDSEEWTEDEVYDLESAFMKFRDRKVEMRQKYKRNLMTFRELQDWFLRQRDIIDKMVEDHG